MQQYFNVPNPARTIDFQRTTLKKSVIIPKDLEYHSEEEIEVDIEQTIVRSIPLFPTVNPDYSEQKPKVAAYAAKGEQQEISLQL